MSEIDNIHVKYETLFRICLQHKFLCLQQSFIYILQILFETIFAGTTCLPILVSPSQYLSGLKLQVLLIFPLTHLSLKTKNKLTLNLTTSK